MGTSGSLLPTAVRDTCSLFAHERREACRLALPPNCASYQSQISDGSSDRLNSFVTTITPLASTVEVIVCHEAVQLQRQQFQRGFRETLRERHNLRTIGTFALISLFCSQTSAAGEPHRWSSQTTRAVAMNNKAGCHCAA